MKKNILIESDDAAKIATSYLIDEKLVALKTETVYGISCDPGSPSAIKKLYKLKKRPKNNPLIIHYFNYKDAEICQELSKFDS